MFDRYQAYANSANSRVLRAENPVVGQHYDPSTRYQRMANSLLDRVIDADDPSVPYTPVENRARGSQAEADALLSRVSAHDDLQLRGLSYVRPSGSSVRAVRSLGQTSAPMNYEASCANVEWEKWIRPYWGFIYGHPKGASAALQEPPPPGVPPSTLALCISHLAAKNKAEFESRTADKDRLVKAGRKMWDNGWWSREDWYDYWVRWSGGEPFYKNPYYIGGIGVVAVGTAWFFMRRKRR